jgi:hypothetical protein
MSARTVSAAARAWVMQAKERGAQRCHCRAVAPAWPCFGWSMIGIGANTLPIRWIMYLIIIAMCTMAMDLAGNWHHEAVLLLQVLRAHPHEAH